MQEGLLRVDFMQIIFAGLIFWKFWGGGAGIVVLQFLWFFALMV